MAKKRLKEDAIVSELRGQSAFFRTPDSPPAEPQPVNDVGTHVQGTENKAVSATVAPLERSANSSPTLSPSPASEEPDATIPERPNGRTTERAYGRVGERPNARTDAQENARTTERANDRTGDRRSITRYSFEFYRDQIATLKKLSLEAQIRGEKRSMSEMVREAIDVYIERQRTRDTW